MPRPRKGESESDFIGRCMDSAEARRDKPGKTERLGMCYGLWRQGPVKKEARMQKILKGQVAKVDDALGLVFGWAIISKINGEPYYDSQDDHIPEDAMLKATTEFMANSRAAKVMHSGEQVGDIVFGYPLTTDIAKALGIDTKQTGFLIAYKPADRALLEKFRSGEFTGFSIGGSVAEAEETEDAG